MEWYPWAELHYYPFGPFHRGFNENIYVGIQPIEVENSINLRISIGSLRANSEPRLNKYCMEFYKR